MNKLIKMISFTRSEIRVILFIVMVLASGFLIRYYKQVIGNGSLAPYDYSESDSIFKERSLNAGRKTLTDVSDFNDKELAEAIRQSEDSLSLQLKSFTEEYSGPKININTATVDDFVDLPGIGESIAGKIIEYRESRKGFKKVDDMMNVKGIGKKKFAKIKNYIKTE